MSNATILFDGVCNLCNSSVQFVLKRDRAAYFKFAALQSGKGQELLQQVGYGAKRPDSIVLITPEGKAHTESDAAIRIAARLGAFWPVLQIFLVVPAFLRDAVYRYVARNRYRWFGKTDECMLPRPEWRDRFLEE